MVRIDRLRVSGLRNLQAVDLAFPDGTIWLVGPNGAGKTSVLEAVYVLSRGSSFRGRRHGPLTSRGAVCARLEAHLQDGDQCWERRWSSAERRQAQSTGPGFLVRLVGSSMHTLLEGDPTLRRRFVDWNVFHVEPQFGGLRQRFRRAAAQRNAWLKAGGNGRPVWDQDYAAVLSQVAEFRQRFVEALSIAFVEVASEFPAVSGVGLEWRSGLSEGLDIVAWLIEHRARRRCTRLFLLISCPRRFPPRRKTGHRGLVPADRISWRVFCSRWRRIGWCLTCLGAGLCGWSMIRARNSMWRPKAGCYRFYTRQRIN